MSIVVNGSGTITGISTGGLPDGSVDVDTLAANSVTAAKIVDGTIVDAEVTSLAASKLTGALPAISGASLTGILTGITDNSNATAITIDASENVGIGVTPKSGWHSQMDVLQLGATASLIGADHTGGNIRTRLYHNSYNTQDGSQKYITTNEASALFMTETGTMEFQVAASGTADAAITWTNAMTITNNGGVQLRGLVLDKTSQTVTEGGQITHNGSSFMSMNATSGGISFAAAQIQNPYWEGQILVLRYSENPPARFTLTSSNGSGGVGRISLSSSWSPDWGDTLTLIASGTTWWNELSRSTNTNY